MRENPKDTKFTHGWGNLFSNAAFLCQLPKSFLKGGYKNPTNGFVALKKRSETSSQSISGAIMRRLISGALITVANSKLARSCRKVIN